MSILPLPLSNAASLFFESFVVFDRTWSIVAGRPQFIDSSTRTIVGTIQTATKKQINLMDDGQISDGTLMLHTRSTIYQADFSQLEVNNLQTFVQYKNERWKANEATNWKSKTQNIGLFILTKYTSIDELVA